MTDDGNLSADGDQGGDRDPGADGDRVDDGGPSADGGRRLPLAPRPLARPHRSRLPVDHPRRDEILAAHAAALAADDAGYLDPETGLFVLTAGFLARRGTCCGRGCRHCPYVDDPRPAHGGPRGIRHHLEE